MYHPKWIYISVIIITGACSKVVTVTEDNSVEDGGKSSKTSGDEHDSITVDPDDKATYIFDDSKLHTFELLLDQDKLNTINSSPAAEEYVEGALKFEGETYEPVGIRYKGSVGGFWGCVSGPMGQIPPTGEKTCAKLSMKIKFNWTSKPEGRFYGLKKLQFHSMNKDNSMMRERLGYALFNEMNVPAPRAVHARLLINGEFEGLFVLVEQIDGRFTRSRFGDGGEGNLYKEIWPIHDDPIAYISALETNTEENPSADKILDFKTAIEDANQADAIEQWVDLEHQMRYIAVDRTIANDDGIFHWYCNARGQGRNPGGIGNHNYFWYEESDADKFWLIPWDLDNAFRGESLITPIRFTWNDAQTGANCGCSGINLIRLQQPAYCDKLVQLWSSLQDEYQSAIQEFISGPFSAANIQSKLERWSDQIDALVQEQAQTTHNGPQISYNDWKRERDELINIIDELRQQAQTRIIEK